MSKHPLGPWTETHDDRFVRNAPTPSATVYKVAGGVYTTYNIARSKTLGKLVVRTGYNHGRRKSYKEPKSASLTITDESQDTLMTPKSAPFPVSGVPGGCYVQHHGFFTSDARSLPGWTTPLVTTMDMSLARNECYRKLVQAINMQDVMGGVMAGEAAKTAHGLTSGASSIVSAYNKTYAKVRGRLSSKASKQSIANGIASDALNLNLNLLPLCADLDGALEALADTMVGKVRRQTVFARVTDRANGGSRSKTVSPTTNNIDGFNGRHREWTNGTLLVKMGGEIVVGLKGQVPPWTDTWGLSPQDFVPTIYELLPYSWLVDYFTTMGSFVDALSLHRGIATNGWKVELTDVTTVYTFTPTSYNSSSVAAFGQTGRQTRRAFSFKRDPFNIDGFVPAMELREPSLKQAGNVLALAASRLTGPLRAKGLNPEMFANAMKAKSHNNVR